MVKETVSELRRIERFGKKSVLEQIFSEFFASKFYFKY